jgi:hypothetical protein
MEAPRLLFTLLYLEHLILAPAKFTYLVINAQLENSIPVSACISVARC